MKTENEVFRQYVDSVGGVTKAAKRLGVSIQLVSAVYRGTRGVSKDVAERVHADSNGVFDRCRVLFGGDIKCA